MKDDDFIPIFHSTDGNQIANTPQTYHVFSEPYIEVENEQELRDHVIKQQNMKERQKV